MAQVILSGVGGAIGGPMGRYLGGVAGAQLDRMAIAGLAEPRQIGPRLETLKVQGASEGAPVPAVFGRARVVGEVIWAARFREHRRKGQAGKGGSRTVDYGYSLSFAVGLCEGPIDGIGQVWADGQPMDLTGVTIRVHRGTEDQTVDPVIEAVEGLAPAYRGLAYVVFEDLSLEAFGDRVPQLAFEVFRRPRGETARLEDRLEGVCLIPGSGEFVLATEPVLRREGLIRTVAENVNNREGRPDLVVSLDRLQAQLPNLKRVTLVVSWFGDDLRCGDCRVRPGVERADKTTLGQTWRVAGVARAEAAVISTSGGGPAYGGTPSDAAVVQAIAELKARGLGVTLAPFLMMDIPAGNGLADPYGAAEQAAYPWRGRITCHPAPGQDGSPDGTEGAAAQVAAFFGAAAVGDFAVEDGAVTYAGPDECSWRRMVLHHAHLAALAGADGLLIGSELRGLTRVRGATGYPAVEALRALAQDCRAVLGDGPMLTYAADWSEWTGVQHADDPGGFVFHLDPLWSDPAISCVGVDWYPPVSDWRDGSEHRDALDGWGGPTDPTYLAARVQGGEGFDWFYADAVARGAQVRTAITDEDHGEPWVFRVKDLAGWWSNPHHDRVGGVRSAEPTGWTPGSKPIRLIEFGCGAVDRGGNAPNLFLDPKSAESAAPPFSSGRRDDLVQRRLIEATMTAFESLEANPAGDGPGGRMLAVMDAWCWDARPFPDFPARQTVWADGANWTTGHWLNGRLRGEAADLLAEVARRSGVDEAMLDLSGVEGRIEGFVIDRPMTGLEAMEPLLLALGVEAVERDGRIGFVGDGGVTQALEPDDLAMPDGGEPVTTGRRLAAPSVVARLRFIDGQSDYAVGAVTVRSPERDGAAALMLDLPLVTEAGQVEAVARRVLAREEAVGREATVRLSPLAALRLEPGDRVSLPGSDVAWRIERVDLDETPSARLSPVIETGALEIEDGWRADEPLHPGGPPWMAVLDLPVLGDDPGDDAPRVALATEPWRAFEEHVGVDADSLIPAALMTRPATVGVLVEALATGEAGRWRDQVLLVRLEGAAPESHEARAVLAGGNRLAVKSVAGDWEVVQFRNADLVGTDLWRLSGLLRGQHGTEGAMRAGADVGAAVVVVDEALTAAPVAAAMRGTPMLWRAAPAGGAPGGLASAQTVEVWRGVARRPWSPVHLKRRMTGGDLHLSWMRRSRALGDGWDLEPPLLEEAERYRVEVVTGDDELAAHEVDQPAFVWSVVQQAADCPGGLPEGLRLRVRQGSALWGWGTAGEIAV